jgi:hypothetical protein
VERTTDSSDELDNVVLSPHFPPSNPISPWWGIYAERREPSLTCKATSSCNAGFKLHIAWFPSFPASSSLREGAWESNSKIRAVLMAGWSAAITASEFRASMHEKNRRSRREPPYRPGTTRCCAISNIARASRASIRPPGEFVLVGRAGAPGVPKIHFHSAWGPFARGHGNSSRNFNQSRRPDICVRDKQKRPDGVFAVRPFQFA